MSAPSPQFEMPAGACDCHMHFYAADTPSAPGGPPVPGHFDLAQYRALQARLGLQRVVVVQPNAYQFEHRVTRAALRELGNAALGVAYVRPETSDAAFAMLTAEGVRAARIFELPYGACGFDDMAAVMERAHSFGWHANVQLDGRQLPDREAALRALPGNFVIDHIGKFLEPVTLDHPAFVSLLRLLDTGRCWVKLSAPYEVSKTGAPRYEDVGQLARRLVQHAPERMLWASNWPHPSEPIGAKPDDADLLHLLLDWAPSEARRRAILVDNPARLYGFA